MNKSGAQYDCQETHTHTHTLTQKPTNTWFHLEPAWTQTKTACKTSNLPEFALLTQTGT